MRGYKYSEDISVIVTETSVMTEISSEYLYLYRFRTYFRKAGRQ